MKVLRVCSWKLEVFVFPTIVLLLLAEQGKAQDILVKSRSYTVTSSSVVQGKYRAVARSPREIVSNYQSNYAVRTPQRIQIKFSINRFDNESPAGQNHLLVLNERGGTCASPLFVFGRFSDQENAQETDNASYLQADSRITIRVDMRQVIRDFKEKGYYETSTGQKITANEFNGVYVAGNTSPLSWNFQSLSERPELRMTDPDSDGIYETTVLFAKISYPGRNGKDSSSWESEKDLSAFPQYSSPSVLSEALYNMSLEEMMKDLRPDGAFMAGASWPGVWTRDISYSSILSLALINPDAVKASLLAKVKDGRIIQDTGTGGSWPVSTDRMVWAIAAWEVYKVTGDDDWLKKSYEIISRSCEDDMQVARDAKTGLFRGESSFLDWREQTYPKWMDPKDIYQSENLGTNAVHYETYRILAAMATELGESAGSYPETAQRVKDGINEYLWNAGKAYYDQYLYGRNFISASPRSEALGEALCVLFGIADSLRGKSVVSNTPVTDFGIPCVYPQSPGLPPYHNDAVWPFVASYWAWASAKVHNASSTTRAIGSVYRAAALFLTNRENLVATTGDFMGTEIDSDRQLWSVAGNLAIVYRVIFGMELYPDSLSFAPCVPSAFKGTNTLANFIYRDSRLTISVIGAGDQIEDMFFDGNRIASTSVPANLKGNHAVLIKLRDEKPRAQKVNFVREIFAPDTPTARIEDGQFKWQRIDNAVSYKVYRNGKLVAQSRDTLCSIQKVNSYSEYQVMAVDRDGNESFLSEPVVVDPGMRGSVVEAEDGAAEIGSKYHGFTGAGYAVIGDTGSDSLKYSVEIPVQGKYAIDFRYANGNGPINTDNKCAVRTLRIDDNITGPVVLPQRGDGDWKNWGYSNTLRVELSAGKHTFILYFDKHDENMNGSVNSAHVDSIRFILISH